MLVRTGYVRWHNFASPEERKRGTQENSLCIGVQGNEATVRWLYDHHLAAVGGDSMTFEAWPPDLESGWCLHEWLLVQWGTPIGEMWDLEALGKYPLLRKCLGRIDLKGLFYSCLNIGTYADFRACVGKKCEESGRWTFFLTSAPLHVRGGVGSPPGAIAVF